MRELTFFTGRGSHLFVGGQNFLGWSKRGTSFFFSGQKRGTKISSEFFLHLLRNVFLVTSLKRFSRLRHNHSLYHRSCPIACSYMFIFFSTLANSLIMWGCVLLLGGSRFFSQSKMGGPEFFTISKADQKKIGDQPSQTDFP